MGVLIIMLLHGVPVYLYGVSANNENALLVAAIISAVIGIMTGAPIYIGADIFAVFLAYCLALQSISRHREKVSSEHTSSLSSPQRLAARDERKRAARENRYL